MGRVGGETMPVASYAHLPNGKSCSFFAVEETPRAFTVCYPHTRGQMVFFQTPVRRSPCITGSTVHTVPRGRVGAPNERASFRIHDAVVVFVDRCLSGTRILAPSNI